MRWWLRRLSVIGLWGVCLAAPADMDLAFTPQQLAFRDEVRGWLRDNIPARPLQSMDTPDGFEQHREWERQLFEGGWSVPAWPEKYGGRSCSVVEWLLYEEEYWASGAPGRVSANGVSLLAPTIFSFATQRQQDRFLGPMASGEEIWSQAWSEPDAGSDLAALSTKAIRDGEWFVLNGQKTWCSRGAFADWYFALVRTDPDSERHHGLSYLLIPRDTAGLEVREVARIDGQPGFAELFFEDARVPAENLLGDEGQGWAVAMATTGSERGLNLRAPGRFMAGADRLLQLAGSQGQAGGAVAPAPAPADDIVQCWIKSRAYRWLCYETAQRLAQGESLGSEASFMKIFWSELDVEIHATALRMLGDRGELSSSLSEADGAWMDGYLFALSGPIYAGTNEIQRNIVAERVLGLPRR